MFYLPGEQCFKAISELKKELFVFRGSVCGHGASRNKIGVRIVTTRYRRIEKIQG